MLITAIRPAEAQDSAASLRLGLQLIERESGGLDVTGVLFGGNAQLAGVEVGDVVMSLNAQRLPAPEFSSLRERLQGRRGVLLGVMRAGRPMRLQVGEPGQRTESPAASRPETSNAPRPRRQAPPTRKPIVEKDGKTLLWALGDAASPDSQWFDMTDAAVDPKTFQYGIGKDMIASIDAPKFVKHTNPSLPSQGIHKNTPVIGYTTNGVAKAYPVFIMDRHEIVNDEFGGEPWGVFW